MYCYFLDFTLVLLISVSHGQEMNISASRLCFIVFYM